jgi:LAS superfamily LD-carboxypeptidase LdcB
MKSLFLFGLVLLVQPFPPSGKDYLLGKVNPETDPLFTQLRDEHTSGAARRSFLLREVYTAFTQMAEAANKDQVKLVIISATRSFKSQKQIWENKWRGKVMVERKNLTTVKDPLERAKIILRYSSMPGSSRHHWGTDMDLNSLENSYFESAGGLRIYQWLQTHAVEYGFCQPYTSKSGGRTGYEEEKWHWSFIPLSKQFLEEYIKTIGYTDIIGFAGSETAPRVRIIEEYVQGIDCHEK